MRRDLVVRDLSEQLDAPPVDEAGEMGAQVAVEPEAGSLERAVVDPGADQQEGVVEQLGLDANVGLTELPQSLEVDRPPDVEDAGRETPGAGRNPSRFTPLGTTETFASPWSRQ